MNSPWQHILKTNVTSVAEVLRLCQIENQENFLLRPSFPLSIPLRFIEKIEKGNDQDPLLLQCVPRCDEETVQEGFSLDPLQEQQSVRSCAILQKYFGRALVLASPACCMNCRFCFRKHQPKTSFSFSNEKTWLQQNRSIREVVLSGGDPLSLPTKDLSSLLHDLEGIPHIQRIRIHTRFPIGIPERIDDALLSVLGSMTKQCIVVVHVNHPRELDADVTKALRSILKLAIPVLTQTVLLKDVNDSVLTLEELFQTIGNSGFLPYYLHQLDHTHGTHHFEVPVTKGQAIMRELHALLPGYLVPRYVAEIPGDTGKRSLEGFIFED